MGMGRKGRHGEIQYRKERKVTMLEFAATICFLLIAAKVIVSFIEKVRGKPFECDESLFHPPEKETRQQRLGSTSVYNERGEFVGWMMGRRDE